MTTTTKGDQTNDICSNGCKRHTVRYDKKLKHNVFGPCMDCGKPFSDNPEYNDNTLIGKLDQ